jgi:Domain of unknown function DUF29
MAEAHKLVPSSELYEGDYYAWIQEQVRALREHRVEDLDWPNLMEEIEDLGKSERRALQSQVARLVEHLLKLAYAPIRVSRPNRRGWEVTIRSARRRIRRLLNESPSLRNKLGEIFVQGYKDGRDDALAGMGLRDSAISEIPPWTLEQVIDDRFVPKRES